MPKVKFTNDGIEKDAPKGSKLIDLADRDPKITLMFGCRSGACGTCVCTVKKGQDKLLPPSDTEARTLMGIKAKPGQRLACQLQVNDDLEIEHDDYW